jgi:uncharacterized protein YktA (UPF0223 family)
MPTATQLTEEYINSHPSIKDCLKKNLINYSALSRLISKELNIEKKTSKEAILVASRRYKEKINSKLSEDKIIELFKNSRMEIKNKISVFVVEKNIYSQELIEIEKKIKREKGIFFSIEGTRTITIIVQDQDINIVEKKIANHIISKNDKLSLISVYSPGIEKTPGVIAFLTGLFFENGINILEIMSSWNDTLIIVESKDIKKVMDFLDF